MQKLCEYESVQIPLEALDNQAIENGIFYIKLQQKYIHVGIPKGEVVIGEQHTFTSY